MNSLYAPRSKSCLPACATKWTSDKDTKALIRAAEKADGWQVKHTNRGRLCFVSPTGEKIFVATTPSAKSAYVKARAHLRRSGLNV